MYGMDGFNAIEAENAAAEIQAIIDACQPPIRQRLLAILKVRDIQPPSQQEALRRLAFFRSLQPMPSPFEEQRCQAAASGLGSVIPGIFGR